MSGNIEHYQPQLSRHTVFRCTYQLSHSLCIQASWVHWSISPRFLSWPLGHGGWGRRIYLSDRNCSQFRQDRLTHKFKFKSPFRQTNRQKNKEQSSTKLWSLQSIIFGQKKYFSNHKRSLEHIHFFLLEYSPVLKNMITPTLVI